MKFVLPTVIRSGQLCSVGDRNILFGINSIFSTIEYIKSQKKNACILSLDFFKAYDRVLVDYVLKVMEKMNFGHKFCSWIEMLHRDAKTVFIMKGLSAAIQVSFSIRQGDPLAMILYIIFIEPLLLYLEKSLTGIKFDASSLNNMGINQISESYCDDINIITEDLNDITLVESIVSKFEAMSGAILSRNMKCQVMGFGKWKERTNWPLDYVRPVRELKIFGIIIKESYRATVKANWDLRLGKFSSCIKSWSSRVLPSISSRVEVIKVFALSRIYYLASILPAPKTTIKKIESEIGKFIWQGWLFRVSLEEVKNLPGKGGLGLTCVHTMCDSLLLSQMLSEES